MSRTIVICAALCVVILTGCKDNKKDKNVSVTVNGVSFDMIKVEAGTFDMGTSDSLAATLSSKGYGEVPRHTVTISKDYYMAKFPVTQKLWKAVMNATPTEGDQWADNLGLGDNKPAYYISWEDCQQFITKLNELTGKSFRLPTEAEWEYAAIGGDNTHHYLYAGSNEVTNVCWCSGYMGCENVGGKAPNELDIYDMSGNIQEWCADIYNENYYSNSPSVDPKGAERGPKRTIRGGCWNSQPSACRVSARGSASSSLRSSIIGMRLCMGVE